MHKSPPNSAGAMFASPHRSRPPYCSPSTSKSMGLHLHLHGNENLGYAQVTTKFLRARCLPPRSTHPTALQTHRCSTPTSSKTMPDLAQSGCQARWNATIFITCAFAFLLRENYIPFKISFDFFDFSILPTTAYHPSTLTYYFDILTPAVAHPGRSDAPEALFTSVLCGCCCPHRCRQILQLRSSAPLQICARATT